MPAEYIDWKGPDPATHSEPTAGLSVYELEQLLGLMKKVLRDSGPKRTHEPSNAFDPTFPQTLAIENDLACALLLYAHLFRYSRQR